MISPNERRHSLQQKVDAEQRRGSLQPADEKLMQTNLEAWKEEILKANELTTDEKDIFVCFYDRFPKANKYSKPDVYTTITWCYELLKLKRKLIKICSIIEKDLKKDIGIEDRHKNLQRDCNQKIKALYTKLKSFPVYPPETDVKAMHDKMWHESNYRLKNHALTVAYANGIGEIQDELNKNGLFNVAKILDGYFNKN